jgi:hypothetical protein
VESDEEGWGDCDDSDDEWSTVSSNESFKDNEDHYELYEYDFDDDDDSWSSGPSYDEAEYISIHDF